MTEDSVQLTCKVVPDEESVRIFALRYDPETKKWDELDVTEFVPVDEFGRLMALSKEERQTAAWKLGRKMHLW